MNYIELINLFWQTRRRVRLSSVEADLYFFLLQECNTQNWENPFECPNGLICVSIGVSPLEINLITLGFSVRCVRDKE